MEGIFTISLDYELHWGVFDKKDREHRKRCYQNTLDLVPKLLETFSGYDVHVTWATVGSLFARDLEEWKRLMPAVLPRYVNANYSAYEWVDKNGIPEDRFWGHFAPDSIELIPKYEGQELGTHTFGHYYCMEPYDSPDAFAADLDAANLAAQKMGVPMHSLVFPRNQFNESYLRICYEKGIRTVRSNPDTWFWTPVPDGSSSLMRKIFRTGDGYLPMGKRTSYPLSAIIKKEGEPMQLPASRLLRAWSPRFKAANTLRLRRVINEMNIAARRKECYHLWWHPENFGDYPEQNMNDLRVIMDTYAKLKRKFGMRSLNMGEYINNV